MEVLLTIYSDNKEYFSHEVKTPCVIGRGKQCDVTIVHPLVSRRHCEIYEENGVVMARDLGSLNGTYYRGARIGRGVAIPYGASFAIGRLMLRVDRAGAVQDALEIQDAPEIKAPPKKARTLTEEIMDDIELVDVDSMLDDKPDVNPGGDSSSVIDLEDYLKNG